MATDARETKKQENGSKLAFEFAIEQNKFPSVSDFETVYPNMPAYWMDIYKVQSQAIKKYLANKEFNKYALSNIPLGRIATESDVATAITFLSSNAASMITGTNIIIDGGWTAK